MSRTIEIRAQDIGDDTQASIVGIAVNTGDLIEKGQVLISLETTKTAIDVLASAAGIVQKIDGVRNFV